MSQIPNKLENYATKFAVTSFTPSSIPDPPPQTQSMHQSYLLKATYVSTAPPIPVFTTAVTTAHMDRGLSSSSSPNPNSF